jgi:hypothetical protein
VTCGAASFYARKTAGFPGLKGKESCKKWQCSVFYVKNLKKGVDNINLPSLTRLDLVSATVGAPLFPI